MSIKSELKKEKRLEAIRKYNTENPFVIYKDNENEKLYVQEAVEVRTTTSFEGYSNYKHTEYKINWTNDSEFALRFNKKNLEESRLYFSNIADESLSYENTSIEDI